MMNWTKLALLLEYETLCNEPELLRLQIAKLRNKLVFENMAASRATQPICSIGTSHGGQVKHWEHIQTTNRILEHGLLKYHHVNASLRFENDFDKRFWNRVHLPSGWGDSRLLKPNISLAVKRLNKLYRRYDMFERSSSTKSRGVQEVRIVLWLHLSLLVMASVVFGCESLGYRK